MHKDDIDAETKRMTERNLESWHCVNCLSVCQKRKKENSPNIPNRISFQKYTYEQCKIQGRSTSLPTGSQSRIRTRKRNAKNAESWGGRDISYIYDHLPGVCYACLSLFWGNDLMRERIDFCLLALGAWCSSLDWRFYLSRKVGQGRDFVVLVPLVSPLIVSTAYI